MITEPKQVNSGTPQGAFLKRQTVIKQDGSKQPFEPTDFRVGLDIGICGRSIRIYDCDEYTREFFIVSNRCPCQEPRFFSFCNSLTNLNKCRIADLLNQKGPPAPRTPSSTPRSQCPPKRIPNSSNTSRKSSVEEECPLRNNSLTTTEKCSDSSSPPKTCSLSGTTSWQMILLRLEKCTSPMTEEILSQSTSEGKSCPRLSTSTSPDSNSLETDT